MSGDPEDLDFSSLQADVRAKLAPTLEATVALLPLVAREQPSRYTPEQQHNWQVAVSQLRDACLLRLQPGLGELRRAVFALCGNALNLGDADALRLVEALAGAMDKLDGANELPAGLAAALAACLEILEEKGQLDSPRFPERVDYMVQRLKNSADPLVGGRSPALVRIFISEASECLESLHQALEGLPPDGDSLQLTLQELGVLADAADYPSIAELAHAIVEALTGHEHELVIETVRATVLRLLACLDGQLQCVLGGETPPFPEEARSSLQRLRALKNG
ncbi:MAG: hypothetical protein RIR00_1625 [Pseudomonadota bacterium]